MNWQPVETFPQDGRTVMVWIASGFGETVIQAAHWVMNSIGGYIRRHSFDDEGVITHWADFTPPC